MFDELAVITAIKELLEGLTNVEVVYIGNPEFPGKFPAITIQPLQWDEEWGDLRDTVDNHSFIIRVFIQLTTDKMDAQSELWGIVKSIRETLGSQTNITLDGLIDSSRLTKGQYVFDQKESKLYFCELTYECRKRFSRS